MQNFVQFVFKSRHFLRICFPIPFSQAYSPTAAATPGYPEAFHNAYVVPLQGDAPYQGYGPHAQHFGNDAYTDGLYKKRSPAKNKENQKETQDSQQSVKKETKAESEKESEEAKKKREEEEKKEREARSRKTLLEKQKELKQKLTRQ